MDDIKWLGGEGPATLRHCNTTATAPMGGYMSWCLIVAAKQVSRGWLWLWLWLYCSDYSPLRQCFRGNSIGHVAAVSKPTNVHQ